MTRAKFGVVILAAGRSERFGSPKQVAPFRGKPLLSWACEAALATKPFQTILVVNPEFKSLPFVVPQGITVVENGSTGLAASIRAGVQALQPEVTAVTLTLGDQPLVPSEHLALLIEGLSSACQISASRYTDGTAGVPAAFCRALFNDLLNLKGDQGAKALIEGRLAITTLIPLNGSIDIDVPKDLE